MGSEVISGLYNDEMMRTEDNWVEMMRRGYDERCNDRKIYQIALSLMMLLHKRRFNWVWWDVLSVGSIHGIDAKGKWNKWRDTEAEAEAASTEAHAKCTMPPALSAERHVRSPSNPMDPGRIIAAIATRSISLLGHPEDTEESSRPFWSAMRQG